MDVAAKNYKLQKMDYANTSSPQQHRWDQRSFRADIKIFVTNSVWDESEIWSQQSISVPEIQMTRNVCAEQHEMAIISS